MVIKKMAFLSLALLFSVPSFGMEDDGGPHSDDEQHSLTALTNISRQTVADKSNLRTQLTHAQQSGHSADALREDAAALRSLVDPTEPSPLDESYVKVAATNLETQALTRDVTSARTPQALLSPYGPQYPQKPSTSSASSTPHSSPSGLTVRTPSFPSATPLLLSSDEDRKGVKDSDENPSSWDVLKYNLTNWERSPATYLTATYAARRLSNSTRLPEPIRKVLYGLQFFTGGAALITTVKAGYEAMYPHKSELAHQRAVSASVRYAMVATLVKKAADQRR